MTEVEADQSKTLTAQCYCKSLQFTLSLPTSILPLPVHLCHCSICRYTHGALCTFHAPLPANVVPDFIAPSRLEDLTAYTWPGSQNIRYFCSTCGCHMGDVSPEDGTWVISTSLFAKDESIFQIKTHVYTKSASDGGLHEWLPSIGDRAMKTWNPDDSAAAAPHQPRVEYGGPDGKEERLRAQCHCGGVSFTVPRPNEEALSSANARHYVSPVDKGKWLASLDFCDDCRLVTGTHLIAWTFVPLDQCEPRIERDLLIGTSKTFKSSADVLRSFCGTCGATVFYACAGRMPNQREAIVDVAVGILRAPEGVRAENWLTWRTGRVAHFDSGLRFDDDLTRAICQNMEAWGTEKYGQTLNFPIGS